MAKTIQNLECDKTLIKLVEGKQETMTYFDLFLTVLDNPPREGWTTSEMRKRMRVEEILENKKVDEKVDLEDADFKVLLDTFLSMAWNNKHKSIVKCEDYLLKLKDE